MKTQINKIKIGSPCTVGRIMDGEISSGQKRLSIMRTVKNENEKNMDIIIGNTWKVHLTFFESKSGKTFWYSGDIPEECFKFYNHISIFHSRGLPTKGENKYSISIQSDASIWMCVLNKNSINSQWKLRRTIWNISPVEIEIL